MQISLLSLVLTGLGRDALKMVAGLTLAALVALAFAISSLAAVFAATAPGRAVASARIDDIPPAQLAVIQTAAGSCGLPWQALAATAKVTSNFGQEMATGSTDGGGYGKLSAADWAAYGSGDPYDYRAALPAMARDLCGHGGAQDLRSAILAYDPTDQYADQVLAVAVRYGYLPPGDAAAQAVDLARAQIGTPYVWGGAAPRTGFDCSGLVQWVYGALGVPLPRTAQQQFDATVRLSWDQLQPGDLLFFRDTYPTTPSEPITHVGMYVGDGRMINAPSEGDIVREMPVATPYWTAHYAGAGRVRR